MCGLEEAGTVWSPLLGEEGLRAEISAIPGSHCNSSSCVVRPSVRPGGAPVGSGYRDPPVAVVERMKSVSVAGCCLAVGLINFNRKGKSVR